MAEYTAIFDAVLPELAASTSPIQKKAAVAVAEAARKVVWEGEVDDHVHRSRWATAVSATQTGPLEEAKNMMWRIFQVSAQVLADLDNAKDADVQAAVDGILTERAKLKR